MTDTEQIKEKKLYKLIKNRLVKLSEYIESDKYMHETIYNSHIIINDHLYIYNKLVKKYLRKYDDFVIPKIKKMKFLEIYYDVLSHILSITDYFVIFPTLKKFKHLF